MQANNRGLPVSQILRFFLGARFLSFEISLGFEDRAYEELNTPDENSIYYQIFNEQSRFPVPDLTCRVQCRWYLRIAVICVRFNGCFNPTETRILRKGGVCKEPKKGEAGNMRHLSL